MSSRPVPRVLLAELERRAWGEQVAREMGERREAREERVRIERVLGRIETRYGVEGRAAGESSVRTGAREGAAWYKNVFLKRLGERSGRDRGRRR